MEETKLCRLYSAANWLNIHLAFSGWDSDCRNMTCNWNIFLAFVYTHQVVLVWVQRKGWCGNARTACENFIGCSVVVTQSDRMLSRGNSGWSYWGIWGTNCSWSCHEMSILDGLILKGSGIVVAQSLHGNMLVKSTSVKWVLQSVVGEQEPLSLSQNKWKTFRTKCKVEKLVFNT